MNDEVRSDEPPADRAAALLRRAGVVEEQPPPHVWQAIVTSVRGDRDGVRSLAGARAVRARSGGLRGRRPGGRSGAAPAYGWPLLLAGAAAGALLTWAGFELAGVDDLGVDDPGVVLASGSLAPLAESAPAGEAAVVEVDGHHRLRVTLEDAPDAGDGYLEVWLLRPDVSGMVTLGVLEGAAGEFLLPPGLDLGEYPVVDISHEQVDGDPAHGGDSLVRGEVG